MNLLCQCNLFVQMSMDFPFIKININLNLHLYSNYTTIYIMEDIRMVFSKSNKWK